MCWWKIKFLLQLIKCGKFIIHGQVSHGDHSFARPNWKCGVCKWWLKGMIVSDRGGQCSRWQCKCFPYLVPYFERATKHNVCAGHFVKWHRHRKKQRRKRVVCNTLFNGEPRWNVICRPRKMRFFSSMIRLCSLLPNNNAGSLASLILPSTLVYKHAT